MSLITNVHGRKTLISFYRTKTGTGEVAKRLRREIIIFEGTRQNDSVT